MIIPATLTENMPNPELTMYNTVEFSPPLQVFFPAKFVYTSPFKLLLQAKLSKANL